MNSPVAFAHSVGNDRGGGDFHEGNTGFENIELWAWHFLSFVDKPPKDFSKFPLVFKEDARWHQRGNKISALFRFCFRLRLWTKNIAGFESLGISLFLRRRGAYAKKPAKKIVEVMRECSHVTKNGSNDFHRYKYATASDVLEKAKSRAKKARL